MFKDGEWITSPGDVLQDAIETGLAERGAIREELGLSDKEFCSLLSGRLELSSQHAKKLSEVIGGGQTFWENVETRYRKKLKA